MRTTPKVTDRALVLYLERGLGVDVGALRRRIAGRLARSPVWPAALVNEGTCAIVADDLRWFCHDAGDGPAVTSVASAQGGELCRRAQRLRRRAARRP